MVLLRERDVVVFIDRRQISILRKVLVVDARRATGRDTQSLRLLTYTLGELVVAVGREEDEREPCIFTGIRGSVACSVFPSNKHHFFADSPTHLDRPSRAGRPRSYPMRQYRTVPNCSSRCVSSRGSCSSLGSNRSGRPRPVKCPGSIWSRPGSGRGTAATCVEINQCVACVASVEVMILISPRAATPARWSSRPGGSGSTPRRGP